MELGVKVGLIVEAVDVHSVAELLLGGPGVVGPEGGQSRRILSMTYFRKMCGNMVKVRITLLSGLIADTPEDDRRVVAVPVDHRDQVLVRPIVE